MIGLLMRNVLLDLHKTHYSRLHHKNDATHWRKHAPTSKTNTYLPISKRTYLPANVTANQISKPSGWRFLFSGLYSWQIMLNLTRFTAFRVLARFLVASINIYQPTSVLTTNFNRINEIPSILCSFSGNSFCVSVEAF